MTNSFAISIFVVINFGSRGRGVSLIIEKTFNGGGATYKRRIKTFGNYFLKYIKIYQKRKIYVQDLEAQVCDGGG